MRHYLNLDMISIREKQPDLCVLVKERQNFRAIKQVCFFIKTVLKINTVRKTILIMIYILWGGKVYDNNYVYTPFEVNI